MTPPEAFWLHLLRQRSVARWGNFSWFSARTLLMSLNDQVAKEIESGQPGSIVDRRRMRWVAAQRDRGVRAEVPIRLRGTKGMLFLGDPGEMDASQYVLVRDLGLVAPGLRARHIDTALLMSDVVYPAGDINQWADAVYLPYFGLPSSSWKAAWQGYTGTAESPPAPIFDQWNVLAMPGNHDWYDGLNGFMYHACGTEPLSEVSYDEANLTRRQRLAKYSWRSPAAPERERVTNLRAGAARMAPQTDDSAPEALDLAGGVLSYATSVMRAPIQPAEAPSRSMPNLPGPYYAADLGEHPYRWVQTVGRDGTPSEERAPVVRIVVVDTGITGTIDPEQAAWLEETLAEPKLPKVVVTGIPLLVNNAVHPFPVSEPEDPLEPPPTVRKTLQSILAKGDSVVATVAGDTHNYQRMVVDGSAQATAVKAGSRFPDPGRPYPSVQIVAGGAGAYMSRTHNVRYDGPDLTLAGSGGAPDVTVPAGAHTLFPSREASVLGYAERLRDKYLVVLLALAVIGLGALGWLTGQLISSYDTVASHEVTAFGVGDEVTLRWFIAGTWVAVVVLVGLAAGGIGLITLSKKRTTTHSVNARTAWRWVAVVVVLAVLAALALGMDWGLSETALVALGLAEVLLLATAHYLVPLLQSFPHLRRSWGFRVLVLAVVVPVILRHRDSALGLVLAGVVAAAAVIVVRNTFRWWRHSAQKRMHRPSLTALGVIPFAVVALTTTVFTVLIPGQVLEWAYALDEETSAAWGLAVRINSLATLTLVCLGVLAGAFAVPLMKSRRHLPLLVWVVTGIAALVGGVAVGWWAYHDLGGSLFSLVPLAALLGGALGALVVLAASGRHDVDSTVVAEALVARDAGASGVKDASLALAMAIGAIPSVDSLAEATEEDFHKNVLTLETDVVGDSTVLTFRAYGLDNESEPDVGGYALGANPGTAGFFPIDQVEITYTPD